MVGVFVLRTSLGEFPTFPSSYNPNSGGGGVLLHSLFHITIALLCPFSATISILSYCFYQPILLILHTVGISSFPKYPLSLSIQPITPTHSQLTLPAS
jgi:hypothetical protein